MIPEAREVATVPLANGRGRRVIAQDEAGVYHCFSLADGQEIAMPWTSFTPATALDLARRVLSGEERTVTASWALTQLACAVLALVPDGEPA